jgi:diaminopropionate ammonia-lyase
MIHLHAPQYASLSAADKALLGGGAPDLVRPYLALWRDESATPLVSLPEIAAATGIGHVFLKDEGQRLGLGSFKALGGAYAVMTLFKRMLEAHLDGEVSIARLVSPGSARACRRRDVLLRHRRKPRQVGGGRRTHPRVQVRRFRP